MMKKIFSACLSALIAVPLFCTNVSANSNNLIVNGDASDGLNGWTDSDGIWTTKDSYENTVKPYDSYFFMPSKFKGENGARTRIYQDVPIGNYIGRDYTVSAYVRTWDTKNTDESMIMVEFLNSDGKVFSATMTTSSNNPEWHKIGFKSTVPEGAVTARFSLYAVYHYGSEVDSYFDNIKFYIN